MSATGLRTLYRLLAGLMAMGIVVAGCLTPPRLAYTPTPIESPIVIVLPTSTPPPTPVTGPVTATVAPAPMPSVTAPPTAVPSPTEPAPIATSGPVSRTRTVFAAFQAPAVGSQLRARGVPVAPDLGNVVNRERFQLSSAQKDYLVRNGFVVSPEQHAQFFHVYDQTSYDELPVFITVDSVLHVYHLLYDKLLRTLEAERFRADLVGLTEALLHTSLAQYQEVQGTPAAASARRNVGYFAVAARLLNPQHPTPELVRREVEAELKLIAGHVGLDESPVFGPGHYEDYSQYIPRGHYTRSEALQSYFRAMMWYGRQTFYLKDASETVSALLLIRALEDSRVGDESAQEVWERIYSPTAFFVGAADDLSYLDYLPTMLQVYWESPRLSELANPEKLDLFRQKAQTLRPPRIFSMPGDGSDDRGESQKGLRLMGQRFVWDAYVFQQLVFRQVGSPEKPRMLPRALDLFAAMGSQEAYAILEEEGETAYQNYPQQMAKLRAELSDLPEEEWTANLYSAWLYCFQPLLSPKGEGYPAFMRNSAWTRKELNTALGSWTELKHDTLLYAKQAYAQGGNGFERLPRGYVEPNPEFYSRLVGLLVMTREGLEMRGLLSDPQREMLSRMEEKVVWLKGIAEKELAEIPLSEEDYRLIATYGTWLESMTMAASDVEGEETGRRYLDEDAAVVADVATGGGVVLEQATGKVFAIYVAVPVAGSDQLQLARGGVYSHYEFSQDIANRLTNESWRKMLNDGKAPPLANWTKAFIAK